MRRLSLVLALGALPACASEPWKPNHLTPTQIAEGWVMLFDGQTAFGWEVKGDATFKERTITLGGKEQASLTNTLTASNFAIQLDLQPVWGNGSIVFDTGKTQARLDLPKGTDRLLAHCRLGERVSAKSSTIIDSGAGNIGAEVTVDAPCKVRLETAAGEKIVLHSIYLRPSDTKPLFNGKDLTGWKVYDPAKAKQTDPKARQDATKSQFTVTKEGWLNVKNGPGDLQTEGQWADFVMQLECISNGKHLNSGLFFRCLPDLYQQGYEAQVRNEWTGDDRTKPVDFGTGAIYRRQPARKVVSTDGEWFTMTVAAHGRRIATWVNGYQVTDWTDDRKEADNARNGFKKGKGALSIQGHDPTTDLSFRNIRIQSLDPK